MIFLEKAQTILEESYGAYTGLKVLDFVRTARNVPGLGKLLVEQIETSPDINIALLLDRDIEEAAPHRKLSVTFEEVSHFVYLCYNHNRGRNITALEMELQSEVDRILLAYHGQFNLDQNLQADLLNEVLEKPYSGAHYEEARKHAARFIRTLSAPQKWEESDFFRLRRFFHSDLGEKIRLAA